MIYRASTLLGTFVLVSPVVGHGQSETSATRLPEVVVTATQTEKDPHSLPYSAQRITAEDLERKSPRTTPDALRELPSIMLQKTSHGQGSPFIRGFTGFRTLMLIEGIRLNNSTFREGPNQYWNTVDPLSLDHLEIVRGPGSVFYGSDAIGGTVNAFTRGRIGYGEGFDWGSRLSYRLASAEKSHIGRAEVSGNLSEQFGLHLGGSWKQFGNVDGGKEVGRQPKTGYDELDWDGKLEYFLSPDARLVLGHQTVHQDDAWRTHSTIYGINWEGLDNGSDLKRSLDQNRSLTFLQYHAENLGGFVDEIHASTSWHLQEEEQIRVRNDFRSDIQGTDVNTLGLSFQFQSPSSIGRWVYGGEYYRDWVDSYLTSYRDDGTINEVAYQGPVADDSTYDVLGFYVENQLPLLDEKLELTLGGRYNYASADAGKVEDPDTGARFSVSRSWHNFVANGRALYHIDEEQHWNVFAGVSQGFRAPNLSDLSRFEASRSVEFETPSPDVDPEHFVSVETGVKTRFERFSVEAIYFHTFIDDMIVRVPTGRLIGSDPEVTKQNSGNGYIHGVELYGNVNLSSEFSLWANFTWMDGSLETPVSAGGPLVKEPVSRLMPTTVNVGLLWESASRKFWAEAVTTLAGEQDDLSASDKRDTQRIPPDGTPGYVIGTLRGGWRPNKYLTLAAAIENITDEDYRIHGSGVNEPGRNFIISADVKF